MKIKLTIAINFIFSKDNNQKCVMNSKSGNIEIMINHRADEVIKALFQSLLSKNQIGVFIYRIIINVTK